MQKDVMQNGHLVQHTLKYVYDEKYICNLWSGFYLVSRGDLKTYN